MDDTPKSKYFTIEDFKETLKPKAKVERKQEVRPAYKFKSGATYTGSWLGGFRHGAGSMVWPDNAKFEGVWSYGLPQGQGTFKYPNGDLYTGNWAKGLMNCLGKFLHNSGAVYVG